MNSDATEFRPKEFYRKLDSLLTKIESSASTGELLSFVLGELVRSFGTELKIESGCVYRTKVGFYQLIDGPEGESKKPWPESISKADQAVALLTRHKNYIFDADNISPWGRNSVAVVVGENDQYIIAFRLKTGWERETLDFSLNTIRSTLNFSRSMSRLRADLQEAKVIQRSLLPEKMPSFDGYDIAGRSLSADSVGGDFCDFHLLDEKALGMAIGDASRHGLPAALVARDVVTGLRMGVEKEMKISGVIKKLNTVINRSQLSTRFVSLVYGELENNGTLVYINAGHPPPLLFKESGVEELSIGGTIIGPIKDSVFKRGFAFLNPGDILFMYTDGILDRINHQGDFFGKEKIIDLVQGWRSESADMIIGRLFETIFEFGAGEKLEDDATAVTVKRKIEV